MRRLPVLVLALAVAGCGGTTESTPETTTGGDTTINETGETQIALPPATATLVKFTMPGMT